MKNIKSLQAFHSLFIVLALVVSGVFITVPVDAATPAKATFVVR